MKNFIKINRALVAKKQKIFTFFLALVASVGTMFAESGTCGENLTWELTNGVLTISGMGDMFDYSGQWSYSSSTGEYDYKSSAPWNDFRFAIHTITINLGVTSIGNSAFFGCENLTLITISNSVTSIGDWAFFRCTGLPVENHLRYADTYLVEAVDKNLSVYTVKEDTKWIGSEAFSGCSGLTSIDIPNSVTSIGEGAFYGCSSLTSIDIPNSVTSIGEGAFYVCSSLTSVTIGNNVTSIEEVAFAGCSGLTSVTIPNSVAEIGEHAFASCGSLTSVSCLAERPPLIADGTFGGRSITLYVPKESIYTYAQANGWEKFYPNIFPITADETTGTAVTATPSNNSVILSWPSISGADTYTIEIRKNGELICTLTFNDQGQLLTINFAMPARDGHPREAQTAIQTANGWQYTVNGLDPATNYTYSITAKQGSSVLFTQSVEFHTNWLEPINNVQSDKAQSNKVLRNGQLFIERNGHIYDAKGQEVR